MLYLINAQDDQFRQESGSIIHKFFLSRKIPSKLITVKPLRTVRKLALNLDVPEDSIETIYDFLLGYEEEITDRKDAASILNIDNTWEIDKTDNRAIEYTSLNGNIVFKIDFFDSATTTIKEARKFVDGNLEVVYEFEDRGNLWAETKYLENKIIEKKLFHRNGEAVIVIEEKSHKIQKVLHIPSGLTFSSETSFIGWALQNYINMKKRNSDKFIVADIPVVHKGLMETNIEKDELYLLVDRAENVWRKLKLDIEEPFIYTRYAGIIFNTQEESNLYKTKLYKKSFVPISWVNYNSISPKVGKKMEIDSKKVYVKIPEVPSKFFLINLKNQLLVAQKAEKFEYIIEAHSVKQLMMLRDFFENSEENLNVEVIRTPKYETLDNIVSELWCYVCLDEDLTIDIAAYESLCYGVPIISLSEALFNKSLVTNQNGLRISLTKLGEAIATMGKSVAYYETHLIDIKKIQMEYSPEQTVKRWGKVLNISFEGKDNK